MPPNTVVPIDCRLAAPAPVANISGNDAEDEGERGHQDRPQAKPRRLHRRFDDLEPFLAPPLGEFDDQNRVLRGQTDQHDEADLGIDVDLHLPHPQRKKRAEQRERHGEQHHERHRPALILRSQDQEDEDDREAEHDASRSIPPSAPGYVMPVHS